MSNHELSPLYVAKLSVNATYSLNDATITYAIPVRTELGLICSATLDQLVASNQALGQSINQNQKSGLTDEMKSLDKERDADSNEIFRITGTYLKSSDSEMKSAASTLHLFLAPYKGVAVLPFITQTGVTKEMLGKYNASPDLQDAAQKLGVARLFTSLETKNNSFAVLYESRNEEYAAREVSGTSLKPAANGAYIQFCTALEQAVNFAPNDTVVALFNKMDELRKKYHALEDSPKEASADSQAK